MTRFRQDFEIINLISVYILLNEIWIGDLLLFLADIINEPLLKKVVSLANYLLPLVRANPNQLIHYHLILTTKQFVGHLNQFYVHLREKNID